MVGGCKHHVEHGLAAAAEQGFARIGLVDDTNFAIYRYYNDYYLKNHKVNSTLLSILAFDSVANILLVDGNSPPEVEFVRGGHARNLNNAKSAARDGCLVGKSTVIGEGSWRETKAIRNVVEKRGNAMEERNEVIIMGK